VTPRAARDRLDGLWRRGCAFLGVDVAVMGGAMTWVSERNLVAAISNAGGFGVIACGSMEPDRLRDEIRATKALTTRPFGVNLIVMHPRLTALAQVCIDDNVGYVVLAGGMEDVSIKITDQGGGIPRSSVERVWNYAYTTAQASDSTESGRDVDQLAGLGYGLPLCRLYARYFGGDMNLISLEGFGTDAYIYLTRIGTHEEYIL